MAQEADIESAAIDAARFAAVSAAIGPRRLRALILILAARIDCLAAAAENFPDGAEDCLLALHKSCGSAASLGFPALAAALARLQAELGQALRQPPAGARDAAAEWQNLRQSARALPSLCTAAVQAGNARLR